MKKIYSTLLLAFVSLTAFAAQEQNDTTYVMFDFNLNPWNYPLTTTMKGWGPDYDDETGAIFEDKDFTWPVAEGSDKLINVTVFAVDLSEFNKPAVYAKVDNDGDGQAAGYTCDKINVLFTNPGTRMRFKAPVGQGTAFSAEKDTVVVVTDTVTVDKKAKPAKKPRHECCEDTTVTDHKSAYHKLVKEGGSMREGLFTVRHIKDDWYLEDEDEGEEDDYDAAYPWGWTQKDILHFDTVRRQWYRVTTTSFSICASSFRVTVMFCCPLIFTFWVW